MKNKGKAEIDEAENNTSHRTDLLLFSAKALKYAFSPFSHTLFNIWFQHLKKKNKRFTMTAIGDSNKHFMMANWNLEDFTFFLKLSSFC